ncbi:MAG: hypothetical protein IT553_05980 [Sphingomonadaceae bacterium]|nr:hypothetical protein [Sphingomonadaceae bacterium]
MPRQTIGKEKYMAKSPAAKPAKPAAPKKAPTKKPAAKKSAPKASTSERAKTAGENVKAKAESIRAEATRKAGEIGDEVSRLYGEATDKARDAARHGKTRAAEGLEGLAKIIHDSASTVDDKVGEQYGDFARSAATKVSELAGALDEKDLDELVEATRDFVRKSPAVAIGSAAVVGFMLARLLRSGRDA